jgi:uncharacterized membrane protein YjjP (DUF1212 family)
MENKVTEIIIFAAGFMLGAAIGWFAHKLISKQHMENWERAFISIIVTIVWVISVLFDIAIASYSTPIAVHAVMGLVAGYFFEGSILDVIGKK